MTIKLKNELIGLENYKILAYPKVPQIYSNSNKSYIFVFTPERLISYLSNNNNPKIDYMFVDEAQKIINDTDSRSPLYYHAVLLASRKSIKLYFSSPNIPNPNIFLQLFEKNVDESLNVNEITVTQNRYFLDLINEKCLFFSDFDIDSEIHIKEFNNDANYWFKLLGRNNSNLVYCNTIEDTINYALNFSTTVQENNSDEILELINLIKDYLHEDYFLIDCLKKGVAFHFGKLPQIIRERIETLFSERKLNYLFCTSTLLEGLNLPAKNIFILSNAIGNTKFSKIDFWNLAGRAGRLTKEFSGNIICMRVENKQNRWNDESDLKVIKDKNIDKVKPIIIKGQKNFFQNLSNSLENKNFTNKKATQTQKEIWNYYANILLIHEKNNSQSVLKSNFIDKNDNAKILLKKLSINNEIPYTILSKSTNIKAIYQNKLWNRNDLQNYILSNEVTYQNCLDVLYDLYDFYNWGEEESGGRKPLIKNRNTLKYYAYLMNNWINEMSLNEMILREIVYYKDKGSIYISREETIFDHNNKLHINTIINELIFNIENILRYKIKIYFSNFYEIIKEKYGESFAGYDWSEFLEYGTNNYKIIELQNIGFSRHLSKYILSNYSQYLFFNNGILININKDELMNNIIIKTTEDDEIKNILMEI